MDDRPKVRTHGFERPFHPLQILSWVVFGLDVLVYALFGLPIVDTLAAKVAVSVCFAASVAVLVVATALATSCDPADPHVRLQDESVLKSEECETMPYCTMCNVPVFARSKHCRACNKCVNVFDHHCMWLNNCIGHENYHAFFVTISSVAIMIGVVLGTCVYLLIDYSVGGDAFERRVQALAGYASIPKEFFLGVLITLVTVNTPLFVLDVQLVLLHAFLTSQQLTTYEYIMSKRNQHEQREHSEGGLQKAGGALRKTVRTLPRCLDWIVFSRCGQRRRKKAKNSIERIDATDTSVTVRAEACSPESAARSMRERPLGANPSPPGSTTDLEDPCEYMEQTPQQAQAFAEPRPEPEAHAGGTTRVDGEASPGCSRLLSRPIGESASPSHGSRPEGLAIQDMHADSKTVEGVEPSQSSESPGVAVASKLGCGCDGARPACDRPPVAAKL